MKQRSFVILMFCGIALGVLASSAVSLGASGKKKQCGGDGGTKNGHCDACIGNCDFTDAGITQSYKVCEKDGGSCEDTVDSKCTGRLMDGGADGQGCDGDAVEDSTHTGWPITCQNSPFKTCN